MKITKSKHFGIYEAYKKNNQYLFTKSTQSFFGKKIDNNYRKFDPTRSKLGAAIMNGAKNIPFRENSKVLYLGASHGYTTSYISDICKKGVIYAIEFAPGVTKDLVFLAEKKNNIIPILADANQPSLYQERVPEVDIIFQDIAQKNQVEILLKNLKFLKKGGYALLSAKARSINVIEDPSKIFKDITSLLSKEITILEKIRLEPFEKDHCFYICQK